MRDSASKRVRKGRQDKGEEESGESGGFWLWVLKSTLNYLKMYANY